MCCPELERCCAAKVARPGLGPRRGLPVRRGLALLRDGGARLRLRVPDGALLLRRVCARLHPQLACASVPQRAGRLLPRGAELLRLRAQNELLLPRPACAPLPLGPLFGPRLPLAVFLLPDQRVAVRPLLRRAFAPVHQLAYELLQLHALAVRLSLPPPYVQPPPWFFVPPLFGRARELLQRRVVRPRPHARGDLLLPGPASDSLLLSLTCVLLPRRASAPRRPPRVCARPLRLFVPLLLEPAWMPALLRLAFARLQPQRAAAPLPVRRVCWQPLRLAREPFPRGRAPLPTRGPGGPLSPQRLCGRLLPWRVVGPLFRLAGALPQRGVVLPRLRAPNDWLLPTRV